MKAASPSRTAPPFMGNVRALLGGLLRSFRFRPARLVSPPLGLVSSQLKQLLSKLMNISVADGAGGNP